MSIFGPCQIQVGPLWNTFFSPKCQMVELEITGRLLVARKKFYNLSKKKFYNLSKTSFTICPDFFFKICLSLNSRLALSTAAAARPCHNFEIARIGIECPMYSWLADVNHQSSTNPCGTQPISTNKLKVPHHYHQTNMNPNQFNFKSSALLLNNQIFYIIKCVSLFTFYRFQAIKCARRQQ